VSQWFWLQRSGKVRGSKVRLRKVRQIREKNANWGIEGGLGDWNGMPRRETLKTLVEN
jgi:hypothetical protein